MADKMTRNVFGVIMMSVWHAVMTLVMLPTILIQWLTGTVTNQPPPRRKMASNGQSKNGCSEGPITEEDVEMLKRSWEVLGGDKKTNGVKFFMKLFTMHPSAKDYFADFKGVPLKDMEYNGETTKANRRMVAHATRVMYSLESYIDSLDDLECLKELVRKIAITHKPRNIKVPQFALLTDVLHAVIDDLVGEQSDDVKKMKSAWTKLMEQVCKIVEEEQRDK